MVTTNIQTLLSTKVKFEHGRRQLSTYSDTVFSVRQPLAVVMLVSAADEAR